MIEDLRSFLDLGDRFFYQNSKIFRGPPAGSEDSYGLLNLSGIKGDLRQDPRTVRDLAADLHKDVRQGHCCFVVVYLPLKGGSLSTTTYQYISISKVEAFLSERLEHSSG